MICKEARAQKHNTNPRGRADIKTSRLSAEMIQKEKQDYILVSETWWNRNEQKGSESCGSDRIEMQVTAIAFRSNWY